MPGSTRRLPSAVSAGVVALATLGLSAGPAGPARGSTVTASAGPSEAVIVFLRPAVPGGPGPLGNWETGHPAQWRQEVATVSRAVQAGATHVRQYHLMDAFAARVPAAEVSRLEASPSVASVIPDSLITAPDPVPGLTPGGAGRAAATGTPALTTMAGACSGNAVPQIAPEGIALTRTDSAIKGARTARSLGFTGAGVKVAFLADGVDPRNVNFLRPDGSSVFADYKDFSGDGPDAPTTGGEAFIDANSIAGQGRHVYNAQDFGSRPTATPCRMRIEGTAPGVSLVGLKVFPDKNVTANSAFLEAIDYAVTVDHVNVLSESFGSNPLPDVRTLDAIEEFDNAAVAHGVTVIVSSGDAGPFGTVGSPASDPNVLSVGASTQFQFYAQTDYAGADHFATHGWLSDNVSALSSGGFTQSGRVVDMVAPGDLSFASCDASARYSDCTNFRNAPSDMEVAGGTSEAAPLTAGAAALVIQAYRAAHDGVTPAPATVRQILVSTASDLGAPPTWQGAGQLNTLKAVEAASGGRPDSLLMSPNQLNFVGMAGARATWPVTVTNTGADPVTVDLAGRAFSAPRVISRTAVTLRDAGAGGHFVSWSGKPSNDATIRFTVPARAGLLTADIGYPTRPAAPLSARVRLALVDPDGRLAAHSAPQGVSGYGSVSVVRPAAGRWTAVIMSNASAADGTTGTVRFGASVSDPLPFGSVTPQRMRLRPGQAATVTVSATAPAGAGDTSGSIVLDNSLHTGLVSIPVTLRGLIPMHPAGAPGAVGGPQTGAFAGTGTGGNGRSGSGQMASYQFTVPPGIRNLEADVKLPGPSASEVTGYLVTPGGQTLGYGSSNLAVGFTASEVPVEQPQSGLSVFAVSPAAGTWTLVLNFAGPAAAASLGEPFTGTLRFNAARVSAAGLPDSAARVLAPGKPVTIPVRITNTGVAPEDVFLDPRLATTAAYRLAPQSAMAAVRLPVKGTATLPEWIVPPRTSSLRVTAVSTSTVAGGTAPRVMFDYGPYSGDPDEPSSEGTTATATFPATAQPGTTPVTAGLWSATPWEAGPYPAGGAPAGTVSLGATASTAAFDQAATSTVGDFWRFATAPLAATASYVLLRLGPGQTTTIPLTITPAGPAGSVVRGTVYADDFTESMLFLGGSELAALPYTYKIG